MTTQPSASQPISLRAAASGAPSPAMGCTGDACTARDPWPLHHIKHRDVFCRLCTSCVLKYHPSQFCSLCLDLISNLPNSESGSIGLGSNSIINCSSCNNVCHSSCLPSSSSSADFFLCPNCSSNPDSMIGERERDSRRRTIDLAYAKSLLCAAKLAAASMSRAASAARADAERRVKEAIVARKRARESLESVWAVSKRQKERQGKGKVHKVAPMVGGPTGGRERDSKLMRPYDTGYNMMQLVPYERKMSNNYEGISGLERKFAPLNSLVGKVEEQMDSKDMGAIPVGPPPSKIEENQNS